MSLGKALAGAMGDYAYSKSTPFAKTNFAMFFNRNAVESQMDRKELKVLGRTGAWSRKVMTNSIKKGKSSGKVRIAKSTGRRDRRFKRKVLGSNPGEPPRYWERKPFASLKGGIYFEANLHEGSVIIGPSKITSRVTPDRAASGAQLLEEGGTGTVKMRHYNKNRPPTYKVRRATWQARPYVARMLEPTSDKMQEFLEQYELI